MICDACHAEVLSLVVHDTALWCRPCHDATRGTRSAHGVIGDEIVGGFVQEHFGHQPEVFYSKRAMAKRADSLGLRPMVRWAGPHDQHVSRWVSVDLEAATALVSRHSTAVNEPEVICETARITSDNWTTA